MWMGSPIQNNCFLKYVLRKMHQYYNCSIILRSISTRPVGSNYRLGGGGGAHITDWGGGAHITDWGGTHNFFKFFFIFFLGGGGGIFVQIIGGGGTPPRVPPIPTALSTDYYLTL